MQSIFKFFKSVKSSNLNFLGVPLGILGSGFRHGIHKATTPEASAFVQAYHGWWLCG